MSTTTTYFLNRAVEVHFLRRVKTVSVAVTELSVVAKAPSVHVTVFVEQSRVFFPAGEVNNTTVSSGDNNLFRLRNLSCFCYNTKLSVSILAKSEELSVFIKC